MIVVLLPTNACLMDKLEIAISSSYVETCNIYAILVGLPLTKKSVVLNLVKDNFLLAVNKVNQFLEIDEFPTVNHSEYSLAKKPIFYIYNCCV